MLKVAKRREVMWPVTVKVPADGGRVEEHEIEMRFVLVKRTEWQQLTRIQEGAMSEEDAAAFLAEHVIGWGEQLAGEDDQPLPFTKENFAALMDEPWFARAVAIGLLQASVGAPAKN